MEESDHDPSLCSRLSGNRLNSDEIDIYSEDTTLKDSLDSIALPDSNQNQRPRSAREMLTLFKKRRPYSDKEYISLTVTLVKQVLEQDAPDQAASQSQKCKEKVVSMRTKTCVTEL